MTWLYLCLALESHEVRFRGFTLDAMENASSLSYGYRRGVST